jgi:GNAT superfamily N-acetyltransferase
MALTASTFNFLFWFSLSPMMNLIFRTAETSDIKQMQVVRHLVHENRLSNPDLVTDQGVEFYISKKGNGWVCEIEGTVIGFSIIDLEEKSVWALFVDPKHAEKGVGKELHRLMINWYFDQTRDTVVLGTAPNTRAERFYQLQGWTAKGHYPNGEVKFELTYSRWQIRLNGSAAK